MIVVVQSEDAKKGRRRRCDYCKALLEYQPKDLDMFGFTINFGPGYFYIICPVCERSLQIGKANIPYME